MKPMAILLASSLTLSVLPLVESTRSEPLNCDVGPITKSFGATEWLGYSCNDRHTLVIVSAPGNPATPFVFTFYIKDGKRTLHGQGTGNKQATNAAFEDLSQLEEVDIQRLILETRNAGAK